MNTANIHKLVTPGFWHDLWHQHPNVLRIAGAFVLYIGVVIGTAHLFAANTVGADSFTRNVAGGWGSAETGGAYTLSGSATTFSVNGSAGVIQNTTNGTKEARLSGVSVADSDMVFRVTSDKPAEGSSMYTGMSARRTVAGDHYRLTMRFSTSGAVFLKAASSISGVETTIGSEIQVSGLALNPGSYIWLRGQVFGTNPTQIRIKAWADGTAEPSTWPITISDSTASLQVSGTTGLRMNTGASSTNYPITFSFDDLTLLDGVDNPPAPPSPPAPPPDGSFTYATDTYSREFTGTWDEADVGGVYLLTGTASDFNVNEEEGTMTVSSPGTSNVRSARLDSVSAQDVEMLARVKVDKLSAGGDSDAYLAARHQSGGAEYRARLRLATSGSFFIVGTHVTSITSGSDTLVGSETASLGTYTTDSYIWMRLQLVGTNPTTINIKSWKDGTAEPTGWQYSQTDATAGLQQAGSIALEGRLASGSTVAPELFTWDDLNATTIITDPSQPCAHSSATTYYIALNGSDSNDGSLASPWRTFSCAISHLQPGDTLYLRGGNYYGEGGGSIGLQGTSTDHITIASYPGERAVIDGSVPDYLTTSNNAWELVDGAIGLWRTVRADFTGSDLSGSNATLSGWLPDGDTQLVHYGGSTQENPDSINSINYTTFSGLSPIYMGPGIQLRGDGHVYIRLQQNPNDLTDANGDPIDPVPGDSDPNNNRIVIGVTGTLITLSKAQYIDFENVDFAYAQTLLKMQSGTTNITFGGCNFTYQTTGISATDGTNVEVTNGTFTGDIPTWIAWTDVKDGATETSNGYPEFQSNAISGVLSGWNMQLLTFHKVFDGIQVKGGTTNMQFNNNYAADNRDDVVTIRPDVSEVEIAYNMMRHVHNGLGMQRETPVAAKGAIYAHHNVIDTSASQHAGRAGNFRGFPTWRPSSPFESHGSSSGTDFDFHLRFYNNTVVGRKGASSSNSLGPRTTIDPTSEMYVYNNLFYAINDLPALSSNLASSGAHYEGDVVWQPAPAGIPLFKSFDTGSDFTSFVSYLADGATVWERNGLQVDPGFNLTAIDSGVLGNTAAEWSIYQPTNQQLRGLGVTYSGLGWPGTSGVDYRGAVAPAPVTSTSGPPGGSGSSGGGSASNNSSGGTGSTPSSSELPTATPSTEPTGGNGESPSSEASHNNKPTDHARTLKRVGLGLLVLLLAGTGGYIWWRRRHGLKAPSAAGTGIVLPDIALTSPIPGSTVNDQINLDATTTSSVVRVDFFVDDNLIGSSTERPFNLAWDTANVAGGPHTVTAAGYSNTGSRSLSPPVSIIVTQQAAISTPS